jgi:hypothetical protein
MLTDVKLKRQVVASAGGTGEAVLRFRVEKSDAEIKLISKVAATKNFRAFPHSPPFLPVNVMCC